jgi:hypothetical protein
MLGGGLSESVDLAFLLSREVLDLNNVSKPAINTSQ